MLRLTAGRLPTDPTVADIGSGPGFDLDEFEQMAPGTFSRAVLLDPQRGMLERARRPPRPGGRMLAIGDAARLPLKDSSTDVAFSIGVLCCMKDESLDAAVGECRRILKPGGLLILGVPVRRGRSDESRFASAGFTRVASIRPGLSLFSKSL